MIEFLLSFLSRWSEFINQMRVAVYINTEIRQESRIIGSFWSKSQIKNFIKKNYFQQCELVFLINTARYKERFFQVMKVSKEFEHLSFCIHEISLGVIDLTNCRKESTDYNLGSFRNQQSMHTLELKKNNSLNNKSRQSSKNTTRQIYSGFIDLKFYCT